MAITRAMHLPLTGTPMVDSRRCPLSFTPATVSISIPYKKKSTFRLRVAAPREEQEQEQEATLTPPLKGKYVTKVVPLLQQEFSYTNNMQMPKVEKIVVNCGMGDANQNAKAFESAMKDIALITGKRPYKTRAKKSIANFKIREGVPVGLAVTLRGNLMWYFLDRLINLAFLRTRDFDGVNPNSFDGHGNYNVGIREQFVFPEIVFESKVGGARGMDVSITTSATRDNDAQQLLAFLGMPFRGGDVPQVRF